MGQHESGTRVGAEAGDHLGPGGDPRRHRLDAPPPAAVAGIPVQASGRQHRDPVAREAGPTGHDLGLGNDRRGHPRRLGDARPQAQLTTRTTTRSAAVSSDSPAGSSPPWKKNAVPKSPEDRYGRMARPTTWHSS
ncbi:hypothetical protein JNW90_20610 [Micromonospora sp. STR1s_5]|nr:hypothetical protein [Micromonospora sp. STR1s_5]